MRWFFIAPVFLLLTIGVVSELHAQVLPEGASSTVSPMQRDSVPVTVREDGAPAIVAPTKTFTSWTALWTQLEKHQLDWRISLFELERAEAATRLAWAAVLPTVNANLSLTYVPEGRATGLVFRFGTTLQANMNVAVPLINFRAYNAIGTARMQEEIARLSVQEARRRTAVSLARAVVTSASSMRLAQLNRIGLETSLERLALTKKRLSVGVGDQRDLLRAKQDVATARSVIPSGDETLRQSREALAAVFNQTGEFAIAMTPDALDREIELFCGGRRKETDHPRTDIQIAQKQIAIAKRNLDDILLKFAPTFSLSVSTGMAGSAFSGPYQFGFTVSGTLNIPLYDGGQRYAEKRDRIALIEQAKARALQAEISSTLERTQAKRAIDVAQEAYASAKEARDLAAEVDRLQRIAYANGVGTNFDLIDAGRRLRETEATLLVRELDVVRNKVSLPFIEGRCAKLQQP